MDNDDRLQRRAAEERRLALSARSPDERVVHQDLADAYDRRLRQRASDDASPGRRGP